MADRARLLRVFVAVLLVGGCGAGGDEAPGAGASGPTASAVGSAGTQPAATASVAGDPTPAPVPDRPAETAGPLTASSLPPAADLGEGWATVEETEIVPDAPANGTWTQQRDPRGVVDALVPMGCASPAGPGALPVPRYALQGTYANAGRAAVGLSLQFADEQQARAFLARLAVLLGGCVPPAGPVPLADVVQVLRSDADTLVVRRSEAGTQASADNAYGEVYVRVGPRVGVVVQQAVTGQAPPDLGGLVPVARAAVAA